MEIQHRSASLRYQVQDALRKEIIAGRLKPGERLVEKMLCAELGVSRTSLREALRGLEAEGLVALVPHRGAVVASVELDDARQIYQVRGVLEAQAVRNFVVHANDSDIRELRSTLDELSDKLQGMESSSLEGFSGSEVLNVKRKFYSIIFGIKENSIVRDILEMLNNRISLLRALSLGRPGRLKYTLSELTDIVEAIEQRDERRASTAALSHIDSAEKNVLSLLKQQETELQSKKD
tara:strand:- start:567 stop:1274 length:708 start_codon:yes stop_codon:yes gene_type:complete